MARSGRRSTPRSRRKKSSKYKGVSRQKYSNTTNKAVPGQEYGNWSAKITIDKKQIWLGTFPTEDAAAWAFDVASHHFRIHNFKPNFQDKVKIHSSLPSKFTAKQIGRAMKKAAKRLFSNSSADSPVTDMVKDEQYWGRILQSTNNNDWDVSWSQLTVELIKSPASFCSVQMGEAFLME